MISYIKGNLELRGDGFVVVETGGLGYQIFVSPTTLSKLPTTGEQVKLHTFMSVKEDGIALYGFSNAQELELFQRLLGVSGVGPKAALGFLAALTPQELVLAILSDDLKALCKAPGIGKKTAQRVVLELKDKLQTEDAIAMEMEIQPAVTSEQNHSKLEAIEALAALGYSRSEAAKAVHAIADETLTTEEILKAALKKLVIF